MKRKVVFGPPGTGKTTFLMKLLEKQLETTPPERIAFVSFTRRGTYEGVERAMKQFNLKPNDTPYFRTIHSICFRALGASRSGMLSRNHYKILSEQTGIAFTGYYTEDFSSPNDAYLHCMSMKKHNPTFADKLKLELNARTYKYIEFQYEAMKKQLGILDYDDLLTKYLERGEPLDVDVAFIDEGQDLTPLQWKVIKKLFCRAKEVYVAGDDDQAVYEWSGANVYEFMSFSNDSVVLDQSYRLPKSILDMANKVSRDIIHRKIKTFKPKDSIGDVIAANNIRHARLKGGELVLARTNWLLRDLAKDVAELGLPYSLKGKPSINKMTWKAIGAYIMFSKGKIEEKEVKKFSPFFHKINGNPWQETIKLTKPEVTHYDAVISRGSFKNPPIKLETFHSSKGSECDKVVLSPELSNRVYKNMFNHYDSELRCLYVGITRAKETLAVLTPKGKHFYPNKYFL